MDYNRIKRFIRWTRKRFKDKTVEQIWEMIQSTPRLKKEYELFDRQPEPYSAALPNIQFALKTYGWKELMEALWIVASKKEETMNLLGLIDEEHKWTKIKDKLNQMPRNVQT